MIASILPLLLASPAAYAVTAALDPQVRVHAGLNYIGLGPVAFGVTGGLDARLTRILSIDVGGFVSPAEIPIEDIAADLDPKSYFHLRHGIYLAPGVRIPHPQPKAFAWDVHLRVGPGILWTANTSPAEESFDDAPYAVELAGGGFAGADVMFRVNHLGARLSGKVWMYPGNANYPPDEYFLVQTQWAVEAIYQF